MKIEVKESVGSLFDTLLVSDAIRRYGKPMIHRRPTEPGQMGGDSGWVELVVSSGLNITAIVVAVAAWLRPKQQQSPTGEGDGHRPTVLIEHEGTKVFISDGSAETVDTVIRALQKGPFR